MAARTRGWKMSVCAIAAATPHVPATLEIATRIHSFSEELLPTQHDNQEACRVAQRGDQVASGFVREIGVQRALHDQGQPHRQTGGKAGQQDGPPSPLKFGLAFGTDRFVDQRRARPALAVNFPPLLSGKSLDVRGRIEGRARLIVHSRPSHCHQAKTAKPGHPEK